MRLPAAAAAFACSLIFVVPALGTTPAPLIEKIQALRAQTNHARSVRCLPPLKRDFVPAYRVPQQNRPASILKERNRRDRARAAKSRCVPWYITAQIRAAVVIGRESRGDPWPSCPDPYDGGGYSWTDTVACENGGNWRDSPGFYRCGLQFHPNWERRFGRLCP
jgi:hypothetical protein